MSVLIVDDEDFVRNLLLEALSGAHDCVAVASAEEALALLARREFDVTLTDVSLPGMSGLELAARLYEQYPDVRVIVMSGAPVDASSGWSTLDVFAYLIKPFGMAEVLRCVAEAKAENMNAGRRRSSWKAV